MGYRSLLWGLMLRILLMSIPAAGDEIRLIPMVSVAQVYNDNLFFTNTKTSDFITTVSPGLRLERNTERLNAGFSARLDQLFYVDNTDLNATDQDYQGSLRYALSPRLSLGGRAGFNQNSTPSRDIETTGLVQNTSRRDRQSYGISGEYAISEKTQASLTGDYFSDHYQNTTGNANNSNNGDSENYSAGLLVVHDLTLLPSTRGRLAFNYANYQSSDSTVDNYSATVGFSRAFNELWNVQVDVGGRYSPSRIVGTLGQAETTENWGTVGNATVSYRDDKNSLNFTLIHDILPASGLSGSAVRTALGLDMRRRLSYEFSGTFASGYFLNNSAQGEYSAQAIDTQTLYITPGVQYDLSRDMAVNASYTFTRTTGQENGDADQSLFLVRLSIQYPLFE